MRVLIALLCLCLALPSAVTPACAAGPAVAPMATMAHHAPVDTDHHLPAPPEHRCIGCVPPGDWLRGRVDPPATVVAAHPVWAIATLPAGLRAAPPLQPPRRG